MSEAVITVNLMVDYYEYSNLAKPAVSVHQLVDHQCL